MNSDLHDSKSQRSMRKFKPRFGLRMMFALTGGVALFCGVILPWHFRAQQQLNAIRTIELNGGRVAYDFQYQESYPFLKSNSEEDPNFFCRLLGSEYFRQPVFVTLNFQQDEFRAIKFPPQRWIDEESEPVTALKTLGSAVRHLDIRFTKLNDLNFLQSLPNITTLDLRNQNIDDIKPLKFITKVRRLYLSQNPIKDYSVVKGLVSLEVLEMRGHRLHDLDVLLECDNIQNVSASGEALNDISALANKNQLKSLDVSRSKVTDISALNGLNLRAININMTGVHSLEPLASSFDLESLDASSTRISDLNPLYDKKNLRRLFVVNTNVEDLSPLENSKKITDIGFSGTPVTDGSVLLRLPSLKRCFVTPIVESEIGTKIPLGHN